MRITTHTGHPCPHHPCAWATIRVRVGSEEVEVTDIEEDKGVAVVDAGAAAVTITIARMDTGARSRSCRRSIRCVCVWATNVFYVYVRMCMGNRCIRGTSLYVSDVGVCPTAPRLGTYCHCVLPPRTNLSASPASEMAYGCSITLLLAHRFLILLFAQVTRPSISSFQRYQPPSTFLP